MWMLYFIEKSSHIGHDCSIDARQLIICRGKQLTVMLDDCLFFFLSILWMWYICCLFFPDSSIGSKPIFLPNSSIKHVMFDLLSMKAYSKKSILFRMHGKPIDEKVTFANQHGQWLI
jgi:hypothetical protein